MARISGKPEPFAELTWEDLDAWAGSRTATRGFDYQKKGLVHELARTPGGGFVAWVQGEARYATRVEWQNGKLVSTCSCPVGTACKHAVAVILAGLAELKEKRSPPAVDEADPRLLLLARPPGDEEDDDGEPPGAARRSRARRPSRASLHAFLEQHPREWLISFLEELAEREPAVRRVLEDRFRLARGIVDEMVQAARESLEVDPSAVPERLEALLERGYADAVVDLGHEILQAGGRQIESGDGDESWEISQWMDVAFRALPRSSRSPAAQLLLAVEWELADDYGLCQGFRAYWQQKHSLAAWGAVADELGQRLGRSTEGGYRRDQTVGLLIEALEKAGRGDEIIPWCEREAEATGNYLRLVERLGAAGRTAEAESWIARGIAVTEKEQPGVAEPLRDAWRRLREAAGDVLGVAAFHAEKFWAEASLPTLQALLAAAEAAGVGPAVRAAALRYLETGQRPSPAGEPDAGWPLPASGLAARKRHPTSFPCFETLIDQAIADHRPEEVLRWYDQAGVRRLRGWGGAEREDRIAGAIAKTHPERALEIWKALAELQIGQTNPRAYESAVHFLRKVRRLLEGLGRSQEWTAYELELRRDHGRKRQFLELLDRQEKAGRPLLAPGS